MADRDHGKWGAAGPSIEVDEWRWSSYTELDADDGDAYIAAPDGSFVGVVWAANTETSWCHVTPSSGPANNPRYPLDACWGIIDVGRPLPMRDDTDAREYLRSMLPELEAQWRRWRTSVDGPP